MDTLHFERYEYKYFVPEDQSEAIRRFIRPYVAVDAHAADAPDRRYSIYNLYLDTPCLDLFRACTEGDVDRFKLRIRWYDAAARGPFFFEVKRKVRQVIVKDRARITADDLRAVLRGMPVSLPEGPTRERLTAFLSQVALRGMCPYLFSRYTREPYESVFGDYARLTFDRAICFQAARGKPMDPRGWTYTDAPWATGGMRGATVLELKFTRDFPRWMSDLVAEFDLERIGYSKYVSSVLRRLEEEHGGIVSDRQATLRGAFREEKEPADVWPLRPALEIGD